MFPKPTSELSYLLDLLMEQAVKPDRLGQKDRAARLLEQVGESGEPAALPHMLGWIHDRDTDARNAAEVTVAKLLPRLRPAALLDLETEIRAAWNRYWVPNSDFRATRPTSWMLATIDPNGRRREAALHLLNTGGSSEALPFVLLRLNDWVGPVRRSAENWLARKMTGASLLSLVESIPILAALMERGLANSSPLLSAVRELLHKKEAQPLLLAQLPHLPVRARRFVFRLLAESGALMEQDVQQSLLNSADPILGVFCLTTLRQHGMTPSIEWLSSAAHSPASMLRRMALEAWQESNAPGFVEAAHEALRDSSTSLRQFAQYWLRDEPATLDLKGYYAGAIASESAPRKIAAALAGFHECGGKWEAADYPLWIAHVNTAIKIAALRAFASVHPHESEDCLRHCLFGGEGPALEKLAYVILKRRPAALSLCDIARATDPSRPAGARLRGLALLAVRNKWEQLPALLRLVRDEDGEFRRRVMEGLKDWQSRYNRTWTQPAPANMAETQIEFCQSERLLDSRTAQNIASILASFAPGTAPRRG